MADQKAGDANRTLAQTHALLKELRLSVAQQPITGLSLAEMSRKLN